MQPKPGRRVISFLKCSVFSLMTMMYY